MGLEKEDTLKNVLSTRDLVFVYGTLKKGFHANYKLGPSFFLGEGETPPIFKMFGAGFPWLIVNEKYGWSVRGEVYLVRKEIMDVLDQYEGYPSFYTRQKFPVRPIRQFRLFGELQRDAWIYYRKDRDSDSGAFQILPDQTNALVWKKEDHLDDKIPF